MGAFSYWKRPLQYRIEMFHHRKKGDHTECLRGLVDPNCGVKGSSIQALPTYPFVKIIVKNYSSDYITAPIYESNY